MRKIVMAKVHSSQILTAGYNVEKHDMYIEFVKGIVYKYDSVPPEICGRLLSYTEHAYNYFNTNIRGKFHYSKTDLNVVKSVIEIQ